MFKILPRNGMIAWNSRSRPCLALPPAESPSTKNTSVLKTSWELQSESFPGKAGPDCTRLRITFLACFKRDCALLIASSAIFSPSPT